MKTTHSTHLVEVSVEPVETEGVDGISKVHHIAIEFADAGVLAEVITDDGRITFTVVGEQEWMDLQACLKAHFS